MPFLELINGVFYELYQINGTKYYKNYNPCTVELKEKLEQCAGEMFLSGIPENITAHQIATIASLLGDLYILRFKVNFAGNSRGYAYLQFINPDIMDYAMTTLPQLFSRYGFGDIYVRRSKNTSNLVIRNITDMTPEEAHSTLAEMCNFRECNLRYFRDNKMEIQLIFGSNEQAVKARRVLIGQIYIFGSLASIGWDIYATDNEGMSQP